MCGTNLQIINILVNSMLAILALIVSLYSYKISKRQHRLEEIQHKPILYPDNVKYEKKRIDVLKSEVTFGETNGVEKECLSIEVRNIGTAIINGLEIREILVRQGATEEEIQSDCDNILYPIDDIDIFQNGNRECFVLTGKENKGVAVNFILENDFDTVKKIRCIYIYLKLNLYTLNSVASTYSQDLKIWCEIDAISEHSISYRVCKIFCE